MSVYSAHAECVGMWVTVKYPHVLGHFSTDSGGQDVMMQDMCVTCIHLNKEYGGAAGAETCTKDI